MLPTTQGRLASNVRVFESSILLGAFQGLFDSVQTSSHVKLILRSAADIIWHSAGELKGNSRDICERVLGKATISLELASCKKRT
jgi:hypothetical protein